MDELQRKHQETDEMVSHVMGVLLIAFTVVGVAILLQQHVASVLAR
jgi:hypothetical protein